MRRALVVFALLALPSFASAQESVQVEQYRPAPSVADGFAISRPDDRGHLLFGARLDLSYAYNPLVAEQVAGDASTEAVSLIEHHLVGHLNLSFGLFERVVIFAGIPVALVQDGAPAGSIVGGQGAGLGDLFLGVRGRFYGEPGDVIAVGAQVLATFPTAGAANDGQRYTGEAGVTVHPNLLLEIRPLDILRFTGNVGARFRSVAPARTANLSVSHELTWGLGVTLDAVPDLLDLYLEGWGSATLENISQGSRESTHFEALLGARVEVIEGLELGGAVGTGLARGFGSPDFRGILTVGYNQGPIRESAPPPVVVGDRDQDGLNDDVDECPVDPEDIDQFEDENGCADLDNDQDDIPDTSDECPNEPEDVDGFEDENGCPDPDNDGDTVLDVNDICPMNPGPVENEGCPEAAIEEGQIRILNRVEFETNSDVLLQRSIHILEAVRGVMAEHAELVLVRVEGHTDDRGSERHNRNLSARRGRAVARWLVEHGIDASRLRAFGCGEVHPIESNDEPEGRQSNRRVEFHILDPEPEDGPRRLEGCSELDL